MSAVQTPTTSEDTSVVAAARAGDESAFSALTERYRRELHIHCYRMVGSFTDAEDLLQETLLRAWSKRESFAGRSSFRAWLYGIATNTCIDFLRVHGNRELLLEDSARTADPAPPPQVSWLQPYPDRLLEPAAAAGSQPDALVVRKETIELAFLVAIQFLPARQRAVLILRDVLDWSARETAELLDLTVASVNAAVLRARETLQKQRDRYPRFERSPMETTERERELLQRYVEATEANDPLAIAQLLREDVRFSMPPEPFSEAGRDRVVSSWVEGGFGSESFGDFRCILTAANRMPAVACYVRKPGDSVYRPLAVDVLQIEAGQVAEITGFDLSKLLDTFGLPATL